MKKYFSYFGQKEKPEGAACECRIEYGLFTPNLPTMRGEDRIVKCALCLAAPDLHAELEADNALFRELLKNEQMDGLCAPIRERLRSNEATLRKAGGN